jgi:hypothetical protein
MLFNVWNGKAASELGGTGDVVEYAIIKNQLNLIARPVSVLNRDWHFYICTL